MTKNMSYSGKLLQIGFQARNEIKPSLLMNYNIIFFHRGGFVFGSTFYCNTEWSKSRAHQAKRCYNLYCRYYNYISYPLDGSVGVWTKSRNAVCRVSVIRRLQCSFVYCLIDMSFSQEQWVAPAFARFVVPNFLFLWGYLKGNVYKNNPHTLEELKNNITTAITYISIQVLNKVATNMVKRARACITEQRAHFEHML
jgi:hypothetical protein